MAKPKTDIVRRSLFGTTDAEKTEDARSPRQTRTRGRSRPSKQAPQPTANRVQVEGASAGGSEPRRQVERTAVTVPTELLMRVKDAVAVLNGWPHQYTMARFVEEAFAAQLERLKREHNGGREFPVTNRKIRTGRPPGT